LAQLEQQRTCSTTQSAYNSKKLFQQQKYQQSHTNLTNCSQPSIHVNAQLSRESSQTDTVGIDVAWTQCKYNKTQTQPKKKKMTCKVKHMIQTLLPVVFKLLEGIIVVVVVVVLVVRTGLSACKAFHPAEFVLLRGSLVTRRYIQMGRDFLESV